MNIAYFINQYPKVSHSFIRREILALEKFGYKIERFALRSNEAELVDPLDQTEFKKTHYFLSEMKLKIIKDILKVLVLHPVIFLQTMYYAIGLGVRSDRGLLRHIIYFVEGCMLFLLQKSKKIDHLHAHFGTNSTTVVMLAKLLGGADYSFTVHGPEEFDKPDFISLTEKIKYCRFVVAISSFGRSQLYRWIPVEDWNKVKIVHCGLDDYFINNDFQSIPTLSNTLVCVGRLCEQKGQLLLLEAVKRLHDQGYDCLLILAGDGQMRDVLEKRIEIYQLQNIVKITGWLSGDQVRDVLLQSRGLILPSFAEGLPVVIMEAMALRRPVISTYVAGIPELVKNGENGWLVPAGDVQSLLNAMIQLLEAKENILIEMGNKGYERVIKNHNITVEAKKLASYFEEFNHS